MTVSPRRHRTRFECPGHIRFLTWACYKHMPLLRGERARDVVLRQVFEARSEYGFQLFAWVIMPDHVHMLLRPDLDRAAVPDILRRIKEPSAREILAEWRTRNAGVLDRLVSRRGTTHFWQRGGGFDRNIFSRKEFEEKLEYIHSNPVRAKLAKGTGAWRWSSAWECEGYKPDPVPPL
ncbi:MAG: REP-associated tyrosine transposase [Phycisphaerales bacterium]